MTVSVFELFSVGVGPSSSHTVGPMRAAARFVGDLRTIGALADVSDIRVDLYGSLAATGAGHGTMPAVLLGLEGFTPETIETEQMERRLEEMRASREIQLGGERAVRLAEDEIVLHPLTVLPFHPNGMTITASSADNVEVHTETYFSVGGGFVVTESEAASPPAVPAVAAVLWIGGRTSRARQPPSRHDRRTDASVRKRVPAGRRDFRETAAHPRCHGGMRAARHPPGGIPPRAAAGAAAGARLVSEAGPRGSRPQTPPSPRIGSTSSRWPSTKRTRRADGSSQLRRMGLPGSSPRCCITRCTTPMPAKPTAMTPRSDFC